MCGICGALSLDETTPVDRDRIVRMRDAMLHRGPDDDGIYLDGPIGLGHRRLAIIDLSGGHQPMSDPEETLWVVFNGEIYNFRELRSKLESAGRVFRTRSDTEVILQAYAEYGDACVEHFRGMFAFALWDRNRRRLLLARDRLGIKPLYYTVSNGVFLFASEVKALLQWPGIRREVDPLALRQYLRLRYVPGPRTMFEGIAKLAPGHLLAIEDGRVSERAYWDVAGDAEPTVGEAHSELARSILRPRALLRATGRGVGEATREFRERLEESVRLRLVSDVPLGVFLSGGLDSTTVVGLMASMVSEPIQTFSVGYPDDGQGSELTEFAFARMAADRFRADHRELVLNADAFWEVLPLLTWYFDEPVADPAAIPLYFLARYARETVTVVLSGEGADELLAGYSIYRRMLALERLRRIPGLSPAGRMLRAAGGRKLRRYLEWLGKPLRGGYRGVSALFGDGEVEGLLTSEWRDPSAADALLESYFDRVADRGPLHQMLYFDLKVWLPDDLLLKADKMTMAASVELRVPFLDHELVEWSWRLPDRWKLRGGVGKYLLRRAAKGLVPEPILDRSKLGFPVPIRSWFQRDLARRARILLLDRSSRMRDFFVREEVEAVLGGHERGREDLSGEIYALAVFALWYRIFIEAPSVAASPSPFEGSGEWAA